MLREISMTRDVLWTLLQQRRMTQLCCTRPIQIQPEREEPLTVLENRITNRDRNKQTNNITAPNYVHNQIS